MRLEVEYRDSRRVEIFEVDPTKTKWVIGRSKNADVFINREELSRAHFEIELFDQNYYVTDLNSTNGVMVNGDKITPGERTLFKNIFPIEIGETLSIVILNDKSADNENEDKIAVPEFSNGAQSRPVKKVTTHKKPTTDIHKPIKVKEDQKSGPNITLIFVVVMIALAGFYWLAKKDHTPSVVTNGDSSSTTENDPAAPALVPFNTKDLNLESLMTSLECEKYSPICSDLGLKYPKEGVIFTQKKLIAFVNLSDHQITNPNPEFAKLKDTEQAEFLLASIGTRVDFIRLAIENQADQLLVVGFSLVENILLLRFVTNVNFMALKDLRHADQEAIFSEIFYGGVFRPYRMGLQKEVSFQAL